ncbi:MAG TPA: hypothetical protein VFA65_16840 [Bryobacteraceae bacterium]|nr:hypothetical protein [Bryobacteraceae bacterium]
MKRLYTCLTASLLCGALYAQAPVSGTINGKPISETVLNPSKQQLEHDFIMTAGRGPGPGDQDQMQTKTLTDVRCRNLNQAVRQTARESLIQQLGIVVTQTDLEQAKETNPLPDTKPNEAAYTALLNAISAVYDKHKDPNVVYQQMLSGYNLPPNIWPIFVLDASTPEGRQQMEKYYRNYLQNAPQIYKNQPLNAWKRIAENTKINQYIDQQLAVTDSTFRAYLEQWNKTKVQEGARTRVTGLSAADLGYMRQKREQFWNQQDAKVGSLPD